MTSQSDLHHAHLFAERYAATLRYLPTLGWYQWNGQCWQPIDDDMLIHLAESVLIDSAPAPSGHSDKPVSYSSLLPHLKSILNLARCQPVLRTSCTQLDADPFLLNVANGTVDLRSATLLPHDPHNFLSRLIPHSFDPATTSPLWETFLDQVTDHDPALQDYLQRAVGYSLTASTVENVFFILYGTGRNGKSAFLTALQQAFGSYVSVTPAHLFTNVALNKTQNTILASLASSRFVTVLETQLDQPLHLSILKPVTTGETVFADLPPLSATSLSSLPSFAPLMPHFKLWLMTNNLPNIPDDSLSFWQRLKLIPFSNDFFANADKHLAAKLASVAPAILAWAIRGAHLWYQSGLIEPPCVTAATADYRCEQDILMLYIHDHCLLDPQKCVPARELYDDYAYWCRCHRLPSITENSFGRKIVQHGFKRVRTASCHSYRGITIFQQLLRTNLANCSLTNSSPLNTNVQQGFVRDTQKRV